MKQTITILVFLLPIFLFAQVDGDISTIQEIDGVRYKIFQNPLFIANRDTTYVFIDNAIYRAINIDDTNDYTPKNAFVYPDVMPKYVGGEEAMMSFIRRNYNIPEAEKMIGLQGRMLVRFVVNEEGGVENARITRGLTREMNNEALRVVNLLHFTPGRAKDGRGIRVNYTIPIMVRYKDFTDTKRKIDVGLLIAKPVPEFNGGNDEIDTYVKWNFYIPDFEKHTGQITLIFGVDEKGEIVNPMIPQKRGICKDLDEEALRVIQLLKFQPAVNEKGSPVATQCMLHINVM